MRSARPSLRRLLVLSLAALPLFASPFAAASRRPRVEAPAPLPIARRAWVRVAREDKVEPAPPPPRPNLTRESLLPLRLRHAAFPALPVPGALVYVPAGIDRDRPLDVVVFLHGWNGCTAAVASPVAIPCRPQGPRRGALDLIGQFRASGRAAVLVIPQLAMERTSGDPGRFREPEAFRAFLQETLEGIAPQVGRRSVDALGRVVLAAHSGGYEAALVVLDRGGVTVDQLVFIDALYAGMGQVARWICASLDDPSLNRRFVSIYGDGAAGAGTRDLARALRPALIAAGRAEIVRSRTIPARVTLEEASATIALLRSPGDHQQTVRWNLATVLRGADLAPVQR